MHSAELQSATTVRDRLIQELAAANTRADALTQQATRVGRDLEDAFKVVSADKEKIEAQLRELDALRRNVETLTIQRRIWERWELLWMDWISRPATRFPGSARIAVCTVAGFLMCVLWLCSYGGYYIEGF